MNQEMHRLLVRQMKKNISPELLNNSEFQQFLVSVNEAYKSYDTEYKQLERMFELSAKESFKELNNIRFALDQAAAVFIIDTKRIIQYVNDNFCKITCYKREEVMYHDYIKFFFTPYHEKEFFANAINTLLQGKVWKGEIKANDKHGIPYWTDTTIVPLMNNDNKPIQFLFISIDITERKNAEEKLRNLSLVADKTDNGVVITDAKGRVEWVNAGFTRMTEYELDEVRNRKPGLFLQGKDTNPKTVNYIREQLKLGNHFEVEILNYAKSGRAYWVNTQISPIKNKAGEIESYIAIQLDVTKRKQNELKLILLERLLQHSSDIVQIVDRNGDFIFINLAASAKLGYTMEELKKMNIKQIELLFKDPTQWDLHVENDLKKSENGKLVHGELRMKNGESYPVEVQANYVEIDGKGFVVALSRDVSSRLEMEQKKEEALQNLRIANQELNDFAYIVSHDLKAPLRAIGSLAGWLKADYESKLDDEGKNILTLLDQRTHRMHNLIEGVLNYSRVGRVKNNLIVQNTQQVVESVVDALSPGDNFKIEVQQNLPEVIFEDIKYGQVFQNLISNAIKYNDKKIGEIKIGVTDLGNEWEFFVTDNGPGIEEQHFKKIFQIFQTLKPRDEYESTGIGLSIVKKIVESNGGKIHVSSEVGIGSTFYFTVPKKQK